MTVSQWHKRVAQWVVRSLLPVAPPGQRVVDIFLRKADEELAEFKAELQREQLDADAVAEEAVDVCNTILAAAGAVIVGEHLELAIEKKMRVLEAGDWYYNADLRVFKRRK